MEEGGDHGSPSSFIPISRPGWTSPISLLLWRTSSHSWNVLEAMHLDQGEMTLWDRV